MSPHPRVRRGAHRTSRAASATLLPSLLAILAVISLITALYVWRGQDASSPSAAAAPAKRTATGSAPTGSPSAKPATVPSTSSSAPVTKPRATVAARLRAEISIVVLNESSRGGLAATVATRLRAKGWTVSGVGNFRGNVAATSVYYPVGHLAAAQAAAKSLPTTPRVLPRFGNLSTTRLTVVVTTSYPG
jgi:hypothetical protein